MQCAGCEGCMVEGYIYSHLLLSCENCYIFTPIEMGNLIKNSITIHLFWKFRIFLEIIHKFNNIFCK